MKRCSYCGAEYTDEKQLCPVDGRSLVEQTLRTPEVFKNEEKESGLGKASFFISIVVAFLMLVSFVVAGILSAGHQVRPGKYYPGQMLVGFFIIGLLGVDVVAVGLGVAALCERGKKRVLGILGLVFSSMTILGTLGLIILGIMASGRFQKRTEVPPANVHLSSVISPPNAFQTRPVNR